MSADSGLSTFRDADGLWADYRIEDVCTPEALARNRRLVIEFYNKRRREMLAARPNAAHLAIAGLEADFDVEVITQNVDDLLQSHTARTMLANSEFIIMLNQASTDRLELAKLLNISDLQMGYITNVGAGQGLLKVGSSLVPFVNKFPRNTELYRLMTTKFGEV